MDFPVRVCSDPRLPERAWIDGQGWEDDNGIYWFSLLTLFFQAIGLGLFLSLLDSHSKSGTLPWWWDIHKVVPLAVEAFWMLSMGLIDRLLDSPG